MDLEVLGEVGKGLLNVREDPFQLGSRIVVILRCVYLSGFPPPLYVVDMAWHGMIDRGGRSSLFGGGLFRLLGRMIKKKGGSLGRGCPRYVEKSSSHLGGGRESRTQGWVIGAWLLGGFFWFFFG